MRISIAKKFWMLGLVAAMGLTVQTALAWQLGVWVSDIVSEAPAGSSQAPAVDELMAAVETLIAGGTGSTGDRDLERQIEDRIATIGAALDRREQEAKQPDDRDRALGASRLLLDLERSATVDLPRALASSAGKAELREIGDRIAAQAHKVGRELDTLPGATSQMEEISGLIENSIPFSLTHYAVTVLVLIVFFVVVSHSVIRPLARLTDAARRLAAGESGVEIVDRDRSDDLGDLAQALFGLKQKIEDLQRRR